MKATWNWFTSLDWERICKWICGICLLVLVWIGLSRLLGPIFSGLGMLVMWRLIVIAAEKGFLITFIDSGAYIPVGNNQAITRIIDGTKKWPLGIAPIGIPGFQRILPIDIHIPKTISEEGDIGKDIKHDTGLWCKSVIELKILRLKLKDGVVIETLKTTIEFITPTAADALECLTTLKQRQFIEAIGFVKDAVVGKLVQLTFPEFEKSLENNGREDNSQLDDLILNLGRIDGLLYRHSHMTIASVSFGSFTLDETSKEILAQRKKTALAAEKILTAHNEALALVKIAEGEARAQLKAGIATAMAGGVRIKKELSALKNGGLSGDQQTTIMSSAMQARELKETTGTVVLGGTTPIALPVKNP